MAEYWANDWSGVLTAALDVATGVGGTIAVSPNAPTASLGETVRARIGTEILTATVTALDEWTIVARESEDADRYPKATWPAGTAIDLVLTSGQLAALISGGSLPANVAYLDVAQTWTATQTFGNVVTGGLSVLAAGGVLDTDELEISHDGSKAILRNRDTGGLAVQGSAGTDLLLVDNSGDLSIAGDRLTAAGTELVLEQTGDTFGATKLIMRNRGGSAGAIIQNAGLELVDFAFLTPTVQRNLRLENRGGSSFVAAPELQFGNQPGLDDPAFVVGLDSGGILTRKGRARALKGFHGGDIVTAVDGATVTFDLSQSNRQQVTLGGNRTLALSNDADGLSFVLFLTQDATGSRTVTWWSGIRWQGGSAPTLTTTANKTDVFSFVRIGSEYFGTASLNY